MSSPSGSSMLRTVSTTVVSDSGVASARSAAGRGRSRVTCAGSTAPWLTARRRRERRGASAGASEADFSAAGASSADFSAAGLSAFFLDEAGASSRGAVSCGVEAPAPLLSSSINWGLRSWEMPFRPREAARAFSSGSFIADSDAVVSAEVSLLTK